MFETLSKRLNTVIDRWKGRGRLTEENIKDALREVRMALLEADVALPVIKAFIETIRERAVGQEVISSITPGQALVKIVHDELIILMGEKNEALSLQVKPPAVVLMAGLQGSGKTTTVAKLARWLKERKKKTVMVTSCDVYRPAAIDQLQTLAKEVEALFHPSTPEQKPVEIARHALEQARKQIVDVLIVDTAGRLHIDETMMEEIKTLHQVLTPHETLFVIDAMTGQDAVKVAQVFNEALPLTGVILTKADGDARGGAALSVRHVTGKPIKFIGIGEKSEALEPFHPDRLASRILGMGDILTLVEDAQLKIDRTQAEKLTSKFQKGKSFDLEDLRDYFLQIQKMGDLQGILSMIPGIANLADKIKGQDTNKELRKMIAIINSMTVKERRSPTLLNASRKRRIASGSGTQVQDINRLLKQHEQLGKVMKSFSKKGMGGQMAMLKQLMPGGGFPKF